MEEDGLAVTLAPIVAFNDVEGLHEYVFAPLAEIVTGCPLQMVCGGETTNTGKGFTVTMTCAVAVQPLLSVPVTVYVVVVKGPAVTLEPVVELKFVEGLHEYVCAPPAVSEAVC
jgi:hypothetical protein